MNIPFRVYHPLMPGDYILTVNPNQLAFTIKNVIFNDPATIVFWEDGSKTVVKCVNEDYDPEKGLAMAIAKKVYGNKGNYYNILRKYLQLPKEEKPEKSPEQRVEPEGFASNYEEAVYQLRQSLTNYFINLVGSKNE